MGSKHVETKKAHEKCNVTLSARSIGSICQTASAPQHHAAVLWSAAKLTNDRPLFAELAGLETDEIGIFVDQKEQSISTIELTVECFGTPSPARSLRRQNPGTPLVFWRHHGTFFLWGWNSQIEGAMTVLIMTSEHRGSCATKFSWLPPKRFREVFAKKALAKCL